MLLPRRVRKHQILLAFLCVIILQILYFSMSDRQLSTRSKINIKYVVVHLDLKSTPLKLEYLEQLLPILKDHGVNALLTEYEDMFPYEGTLVHLRAKNYYSKDRLIQFLNIATGLGFEIIPLMQTFGHLEFVLKHEYFSHLRENYAHKDDICPSKAKSRHLITNMIKQVMALHENIVPLKHFHIGCDEVRHLNECPECKQRNKTRAQIYMEHLKFVTKIVKLESNNKITLLIWDDMIRTVSPVHWDYNIYLPAEPVCWDYSPQIQSHDVNFMKYHKTFSNIWIATAFKGADGFENVLPDVRLRFLNHYSWLNKIHKYKFGGENNVFDFKGIILTGWSRYSHFSKPCDLLPVSFPSLMINLLLIRTFKEDITSETIKDPSYFFELYVSENVKRSLRCDNVNMSISDTEMHNFDNLLLENCDFNEWTIYNVFKNFLRLQASAVEIYKDTFSLKYDNEQDLFKSRRCSQISKGMQDLTETLIGYMNRYYHSDFVTDYVSDKRSSFNKLIKKCFK